MKKEKKIPTILGLIILLLSIAAGIYLTKSPVSLGSRAGEDCRPLDPQISNITNKSFAVSFLTPIDCLVNLHLNNQLVSDSQASASKTHYFQVDNLKQNTQYNFEIISGGKTYTSSKYSLKTGQSPKSDTPTSNLAWGKVYTPDQKPAQNAIIFLNVDHSQPLSTRVNEQGYWNISLANSFNQTLDDWFVPPANSYEQIIVFYDDGSTTVLNWNTSKNNPVPDIIIGQNEFSQDSSSPQGSLPSVPDGTSSIDLTLKNPSEGETLTTQKPDFFGTAPLGADITIKVESDQVFESQISPQTDGTWNWSPPQNLEPGEHTVTLTATNPQTGLVDTIVRKFTVLAADTSQPAFSASSSGTLPTSTPKPTTTMASSPTSTPQPTSTPIPTQIVQPTIRPTMPVSGSPAPTIILATFGVLLVIIALGIII